MDKRQCDKVPFYSPPPPSLPLACSAGLRGPDNRPCPARTVLPAAQQLVFILLWAGLLATVPRLSPRPLLIAVHFIQGQPAEEERIGDRPKTESQVYRVEYVNLCVCVGEFFIDKLPSYPVGLYILAWIQYVCCLTLLFIVFAYPRLLVWIIVSLLP